MFKNIIGCICAYVALLFLALLGGCAARVPPGYARALQPHSLNVIILDLEKGEFA